MNWYENWIEVFKSGTHTDSSGNTRAWTNEDLDTIVEKYDREIDEAPVVLGHPQNNDEPAYAWVCALKREGDVLLAKLTRVCPEFATWVEKGLYRKVSVALGADLSLRHVGFLGASNPAVKGLLNEFSIDKSEKNQPRLVVSERTLLGKIERKGRKPAGENCLSPHSGRVGEPSEMSLEMCERELGGGFYGTFLKKFPCGAKLRKDKDTMFKKQSTSEFAQRVSELERELESAQKVNFQREFGDFLGELHAQAKITAEDKIRLEKVFEYLAKPDGTSFFAQGDASSEPNSDVAQGFQAFTEFLSNLPARCEFGELATRKNAPKGTYRTHYEELGMKIAKSI